ncbi:MAG: cbb3-type cytochrome c oxidase subunit I [Phycisphaerales bacterium]|nr:cbb3-type cytochrome c oxidase subunit I [Phycisphaerales bacterium]
MTPGNSDLDRGRRFLTRFGLLCLWIALGVGLVGALFYTKAYNFLDILGISFQTIRPLHLLAGTAWMYLGGLAVVTYFWSSDTRRESSRAAGALKFFIWTWVLGALVVVVTLLLKIYGGREYFFASEPASVLFWVGWGVLAIGFTRDCPEVPGPKPAYLWMWFTSLGLFTYAFVETHVFLLPYFKAHPIRDMAVEWKSYGTLVGSFNLLVYGALAYLGHRLNPARDYSRSRMAFALFIVGVLNSFTNYGHHTFHLPQSLIVKWTSFVISMSEIAILAKVAYDVLGIARRLRDGKPWDGVTWLLAATTTWTFVGLTLSIVISVPPVNALVHGTLVVAGHAMSSMVGIDTMGLLAVLGWIHLQDHAGRVTLSRFGIALFNIGAMIIWSSFMTVGISDSLDRWQAGILPSRSLWPGWFPYAFLLGGLSVFAGVARLTWSWFLPVPKREAADAQAHSPGESQAAPY